MTDQKIPQGPESANESDSRAPGTAGISSRFARRISLERLERLAGAVTLDELARASGVSRTALSMSERGFTHLSTEQERARREALRRLIAEKR